MGHRDPVVIFARSADETENYANEAQLDRLEKLNLTPAYVVAHAILNKPDYMLVEDWPNRQALWIAPDGTFEKANTPYPWCIGNSYRANCVAAGYCRRNPNCGN